MLTGTISERLKELVHRKCVEIKVDIIELEIMPDHVHLLIEVDSQFGINRAVRNIKGFTSHPLREEFKELTTRLPTLWTNSYFVSTVGDASLAVIKQYTESQKTSKSRFPQNIHSKRPLWIKGKKFHAYYF